MAVSYPRIASLKTADAFAQRLQDLNLPLPFDRTMATGPDAPLARPLVTSTHTIGNRFCILPMEGWDGTPDGRPSDLTHRRWQRFGQSGAKLIWGGEAVAVRHDGRANPNQLAFGPHALEDLSALRNALLASHKEACGNTDDLFIGLQLTHSGRYARPNPGGNWEPQTAYVHPILDRRFPPGTRTHHLTDDDLRYLVDDFIRAARIADQAGFDFVDLKHCHGYLGHELLSATTRQGPFGGPLEHRTAFLRQIVSGIRAEAPRLQIGVRLSAFDAVPYRKNPSEVGTPEIDDASYHHAFGPLKHDAFLPSLDDARAFLAIAESMGIAWFCITGGSPYYNPHIQRPALFPPSDGYQPPEDPLVGVARQIAVVSLLKQDFPNLHFIGSGYSYLQEWLPNVGQAAITNNATDFVGLGRMVLSYPDLPRDVLAGRPMHRPLICRTFSDCTSGPRNGLVSGCFPLDPFYKAHPDALRLKSAKTLQAAK
jgi:2,4-dienoyl-CoA reductase-like NADH-dependent reductase (Old Yellow Enzyme family)